MIFSQMAKIINYSSLISGVNKMKKPTKKSPAKPKIKPVIEKPVKAIKPESSVQSISLEQQQSTTQDPVIKPPRRASVTPSSSKVLSVSSASQNIGTNIITVTSPQRGTSLLLSNNLSKQQQPQQIVEVTSNQSKAQVQVNNEQSNINQEQGEQSKEDKEIKEALQAIMQNRVSSPTIKTSEN